MAVCLRAVRCVPRPAVTAVTAPTQHAPQLPQGALCRVDTRSVSVMKPSGRPLLSPAVAARSWSCTQVHTIALPTHMQNSLVSHSRNGHHIPGYMAPEPSHNRSEHSQHQRAAHCSWRTLAAVAVVSGACGAASAEDENETGDEVSRTSQALGLKSLTIKDDSRVDADLDAAERRMAEEVESGVVLSSAPQHSARGFWERIKGISGYRAFRRVFSSMIVMAIVAADYKLTWRRYTEEKDPLEYADETSRLHTRCALRILRLCQKNKGLYIKVGQYMASMNHVLPEEYIRVLRVLQDAAPTMTDEELDGEFKRELGGLPEDLFAEFDRTPLAAASLAQVHRAVTHDGREIAIKVQYPFLAQDFAGDMFTHWMILRCAKMVFSGFELEWMHDEVEENLQKELDFINEARNGERCADFFASTPNIHVPEIVWKYTTSQVLAMEFIRGVKITDTRGLEQCGVSTAQAMEAMVVAMSKQIFQHGFVHCDPHPGNLFIRNPPKDYRHKGTGSKPSWQLVLLDHGLYRQISDDTRVKYCKLWKELVLRNDEKVAEYTEQLGIPRDYWRYFAVAVLMRPYAGKVGFGNRITYDEHMEFRSRTHQNMQGIFHMMRSMPRELLLVLRNQNYIRALNHELGHPINRFRIMAREAVKGSHHVNYNATTAAPQPSHHANHAAVSAPQRMGTQTSQSVAVQQQHFQQQQGSWISRQWALLYERTALEVNLFLSDVSFWAMTTYLSWFYPGVYKALEERQDKEVKALLAG